jgi:VWFA-related protein
MKGGELKVPGWRFEMIRKTDQLKCIIAVFIALPALALGVPQALADGPDYTTTVTQVDNSRYPEVTIYVSVKDKTGVIVPGLSRDNFAVTEDGKPVEIVDFKAGGSVPINTILAIDVSGSMASGSKMQGAIEAGVTFVNEMHDQDRAALIAFNDQVYPLQDFTSDRSALAASLRSLSAGGGTAWYDATWQALDQISALPGRRSLILLSDGFDNRDALGGWAWLLGAGSQHTFEELQAHASRGEVPAYVIGLGEPGTGEEEGGIDESRLRQLAGATHGRYYHAPTATELKELYASLSAEMHKEYQLTYKSPRPTYDGTRRRIEVTVSLEGGGTTSGGGGYLEEHLINVRSTPLIGLILLIPLLIALAVPAFVQRPAPRRAQPVEPPRQRLEQIAIADRVPPEQIKKPASPTCPHCGNSVRPGLKFCNRCGRPLAPPASAISSEPVANTCPRCGAALRPGARFCGSCGLSIGGT